MLNYSVAELRLLRYGMNVCIDLDAPSSVLMPNTLTPDALAWEEI